MEEIETFSQWCIRVKEEHPNAPWEDQSVDTLYKMYKAEQTK